MSYKLIKDHTFINYTEGNTGREYIVIHYTGNNTDTATANANYFRNVDRQASAHYFVDEVNVVEVVAPENTAWAVGVDYGGRLFGKCNNSNSISIEMCSDNGKISDGTFNNTVELTKKLMKDYNIPESRVVRHYDVCNKLCPGWTGWTGPDTSEWERFKKALITKKVKTKKTANGYARAEVDPVANSVQVKIKIPKGEKLVWLRDDEYGWSEVKYQAKKMWVINSRLNDNSLSKCPKVTVPQGSILKKLHKDKSCFVKQIQLGKATTFTCICLITEGEFKGKYYLKRGLNYYYW